LELLRHWAVFFPRQANPSRCAACAFELWHPYRCHGPFCKEYEIEALVGRRPLPRTIGSRRLVMPSVGAPFTEKTSFCQGANPRVGSQSPVRLDISSPLPAER